MYLKLYRVIEYSNVSWSDETVERNEISFLRDSQVFAFLKIARSLPVVPAMAETPDWKLASTLAENFASNVCYFADHYY